MSFFRIKQLLIVLLLVCVKNLEQIKFLISEQANQSLRIRVKGSGGLSMSSSKFATCSKSLSIDIYRGGHRVFK